ncbi:class I SAM-dependent methyltransferase [Stieleria neptunia]|uniref:class I SAM-dependent methyltransferase n=1 Tax=Stieleria neptunia TaxID=2527979 RepID=UPI001E5084A3|nr:class I SAM-dependent methyltransferase [Stieleria neptunia]
MNERPDGPGYRLLDFGQGRKLESFGGRILDRPSPAADGGRKHHPDLWAGADSVFHDDSRHWEHRTTWPADLRVECDGFRMPIAPTPFGHVGVFPEQAANWRWLRQTAARTGGNTSGMNLFAYTGASSIVMAATGMNVAHVDAAKPNVSAARAAAELNGLADHPIRYLVDDAAKFTAREVRRGNRYQTIVLDPPAYGHGPSGKAWRLQRDLWPLLGDCLSLLTPDSFRLLITGHSPQVAGADVVDYLASRLPKKFSFSPRRFDSIVDSGRLTLDDSEGRKLDAGFFVRVTFHSPDA